jgi:uncharacterized protein YgiM (DUF1202 family)
MTMRNWTPKMILAAAAAASMGIAAPASAGVTGCAASGGKQEAGAVIGAVVGGLIGNKVGGRKPALETVGGAAAGAAAGSAIGCEMQKSKASKASNSGTYAHSGYRLSRQISPANYRTVKAPYRAAATVNLRAAPTTNSARVGQLRAGERFEALAEVRGTDWILVGQGGVGVGYVKGVFVEPDGRRYANAR